jgi:hypothetical protein
MKDKKLFYRRKFINPHGDGAAYLLGKIERRVHSGTNERYDYDAYLKIADCNRVIDLEFDVYGDLTEATRSLAARVNKVNVLIDALTAFRDVLDQEHKALLKRKYGKGKE